MELFDKQINQRFALFCNKYIGKTQAEVAEVCECSQKHISIVFNMKAPVSLNMVLMLTKKKDLNYDWLTTGLGPLKRKELPKENLITNIYDLQSEMLVMRKYIEQMQSLIKKLVTDFYDQKK